MGLLAQTNTEIRSAEDVHRRRLADDAFLRRPIVLIDRLLQDLEELNLRGVKRVPASFEERLDELARTVDGRAEVAGIRATLRVKIGVGKLMDALFALQDVLLRRRRPDVYPGEEDDLLPDPHDGALISAA